MTTPTHCTSCGHELGVGRFCTNCGQPVPGRHPEAAPVASAPVVPPPTGQLPPAARYPLYADSPTAPSGPPPLAPPAVPAAVTQVAPPPPSAPLSPAPPPAGGSTARTRLPWLPWLLGVVVLALVAGIGAFLLVSAGDDDGSALEQRAEEAEPSSPSDTDRSGEPRPDSSGTGGPVEAPEPGDLRDLTATARAEVPATAPASRDRQNRPVTYVADNMLDGRPRTAWRMPGDGTGTTLVLDLGAEVVLTEVGLVNGYAKIDGADNWYRGNRRIRAVQWEFDDGTRITQELGDRPSMQLQPVGPVATTTVVLHLVEVSAPGKGPGGRDFTAISDLRLRGARR
ncbi:NADase-type glycan-binding domain-containing protein [Nocardioides daeguensis]|uniref:NAD glycohydrolase translocation F5/8 type C domain-containing protein n=1 Tax=Nocardioides daeguensis TaxID=908359 RepID=A0ABP6UVQ7_9ACTN|nr:hypothetical protein [Nocardioides daeguensis]MBV6725715.1 hypothetical protein [Nocardioides daeguensis]MCR1772770.1 hypothetical protein [Nocardioides daeguensis]